MVAPMSTPEITPMTEPPVRRIEVFTGAGRRRRWPAETKARIVAETLGGVESVSQVARRHGLEPSQVFAWRRLFKRSAEASGFAAIVAEPAAGLGLIELELAGARVRIGRGAETQAIAAVIGALKAPR